MFFNHRVESEWSGGSHPNVFASVCLKSAGTGVTVLDCGARQCEILPPGVNKGGADKITYNFMPSDMSTLGRTANDSTWTIDTDPLKTKASKPSGQAATSLECAILEL